MGDAIPTEKVVQQCGWIKRSRNTGRGGERSERNRLPFTSRTFAGHRCMGTDWLNILCRQFHSKFNSPHGTIVFVYRLPIAIQIVSAGRGNYSVGRQYKGRNHDD